jgi:hypothetical protein
MGTDMSNVARRRSQGILQQGVKNLTPSDPENKDEHFEFYVVLVMIAHARRHTNAGGGIYGMYVALIIYSM